MQTHKIDNNIKQTRNSDTAISQGHMTCLEF